MLQETIYDFFPSVHNDDLIPVGKLHGTNICAINYEQKEIREQEYNTRLIALGNLSNDLGNKENNVTRTSEN